LKPRLMRISPSAATNTSFGKFKPVQIISYEKPGALNSWTLAATTIRVAASSLYLPYWGLMSSRSRRSMEASRVSVPYLILVCSCFRRGMIYFLGLGIWMGEFWMLESVSSVSGRVSMAEGGMLSCLCDFRMCFPLKVGSLAVSECVILAGMLVVIDYIWIQNMFANLTAYPSLPHLLLCTPICHHADLRTPLAYYFELFL
jgi:hypothetical protein